jgi:uncharacterized protein (TIGR02231 family)
VEISYVIKGAHWEPFYDLRLVEGNNQPRLEVGYLAQVGQVSGECWEAVCLTLSTARPAMAHTLPELEPWFVSPPPPPRPKHIAAAPQARMLSARSNADMGEMLAKLEMAPAEEVTAVVDNAGSVVTYVIPAAVTIPPDGSLHKVLIARFPLTPQLDFVSAPKLVPAAYRRARIQNSSPYTLLPGEANIFTGDEYIGTTPLALTAPQGEIELYLGSEDRIKVERELKRREVDKRLIGGRRHMAFGYEINVENLLSYAVKLILHDQFPVSRHEEIKVRLEAADPKPVEVSEMNLLRWEFSLEPKEKRSVRFDFLVDSPQGMEVAGIPG